ncbi:MAG TPA: OmpH family outer membrane protein [Chromatiaceae bacterium]|jgi:outer membrane protein|nr:OmpH family outer membrane protein [Chromatiaceae bacterium]
MLTCVRLAAVGGLCLAAQAQALDYKIGVVDPERVIEESPQYEAARQALQEEVADRERALREQQAKLDELKKNLERDAPLMSEEELARLQNDIRNRDRKVKYAKAEFQEDFALRQNELRTRLIAQVREVVQELAKEQKIDLIVSEGVVYFSERVDMSAQVIERLQSKAKRK